MVAKRIHVSINESLLKLNVCKLLRKNNFTYNGNAFAPFNNESNL